MNCVAKHVKYEPKDEEWTCPKCGSGIDSFVIEECDSESDDVCMRLHDKDFLKCECGYSTSGRAFSNLVVRKNSLVPCPHCKGKGFVRNEKSG